MAIAIWWGKRGTLWLDVQVQESGGAEVGSHSELNSREPGNLAGQWLGLSAFVVCNVGSIWSRNQDPASPPHSIGEKRGRMERSRETG